MFHRNNRGKIWLKIEKNHDFCKNKKILVWCDDPPEDRVISIVAGCLANHDRAHSPNENQSDSYHETHLWPWPLSSISGYHQLCEIVAKRRSISRKGIHSWWPSVSRSQVVRVVWNRIFLDCTKCTTMTRKESLNLLTNEKFSIILKVFLCYQWHWLFLLDGL
jgi:hypothetical protein